jgi:hypothetical protein
VKRRSLLLLCALLACNGAAAPDGADAGSIPDASAPDPQLPPQGQAALEPWLATGFYKQWTCERSISDKRLNGAHGRHRVCSNGLLVGSLDGPYPVGAASVKELYDPSDRPNGYAVGVKVAAGLGEATWYWYERTGTSATSRPVADAIGAAICAKECHAAAPRDSVYIRAQ